MGNSSESGRGFGQWLQQLGGLITGVVGFVTGLVGFVQLVKGNAGLVTLILLVFGIGLIWLTCLYFERFWQPEQQDETAGFIQPALTDKQVKLQQQKEQRRKAVRRSAVAGLVLVPLLTLGGFASWQHVQSLPSDKVVILVAQFDGPEGQNNRVTETILSQLREATEEYSDVKVEALEKPITEQAGSEEARKLGKKRKATMMIWGWYGKTADTVPISVNFEVLQPPEGLPEFGKTASGSVQTFALSELNSFKLQTRLSSEMSYLTLFTLGMVEYAAEDWAAAIAHFDDALAQTNESPESLDLSITHLKKGNSYFFNKDFEAAIAAYDAALKIKPDYPEALNNKGAALGGLGRYEDAIAAHDAALKIKPDYPEALNNKGSALGELGYGKTAIISYDGALKIKPDFPEALNNKGIALNELGRYEEAIAAYNAALKIQPDYPDALNNKGITLHELGRHEEAITAYNATLKLKPDYPDALYNKGNALNQLGRHEDAIIAYNAALKLKPDDHEVLYNKGHALHGLGRYEEAIATYDASLKLQPDNYDSYLNIARCYALLNKPQQSLDSLEKFIQLVPGIDRESIKSSDGFESLHDQPRFKALTSTTE
jgi:tetratricopeptide (TPR) repeat protein